MKNQNQPILLQRTLLKGFPSYKSKFKSVLLCYPRLCLALMVFMMIGSAVLCFLVKKEAAVQQGSLYPDLKQSMPAGPQLKTDALLEIFVLQAELKTFLDKKVPDSADSIRMENLLSRIEKLNEKLKENGKN